MYAFVRQDIFPVEFFPVKLVINDENFNKSGHHQIQPLHNQPRYFRLLFCFIIISTLFSILHRQPLIILFLLYLPELPDLAYPWYFQFSFFSSTILQVNPFFHTDDGRWSVNKIQTKKKIIFQTKPKMKKIITLASKFKQQESRRKKK